MPQVPQKPRSERASRDAAATLLRFLREVDAIMVGDLKKTVQINEVCSRKGVGVGQV